MGTGCSKFTNNEVAQAKEEKRNEAREESEDGKGLGSLNEYQEKSAGANPPSAITEKGRSYSPIFGKDLSKNSTKPRGK